MKDGVVWLIDNKAVQTAKNISSVSALTTNLARNVAEVRAALTGMLERAASLQERQLLQQALRSLDSGNYIKAISNATVDTTQVARDISGALKRQGFRFIDLLAGTAP